jgi:hypothetical protein
VYKAIAQFKLSDKFALTPLGLLELFHKEKELEHTAKLNAWTHLYLGT